MVAIGAVLMMVSSSGGARETSSRSTQVRGNPGQFFGPDEYPPEALRNREQGRAVASLTIDKTGRVTDCRIMESSGSTALDVRTCVIAVGRVTFVPATDDAGRPIASRYTLPVRWVLPEAVPAPRRSTDELLTLTIAADDRVEACDAMVNGKPVPAVHPFCREWQGDNGAVMLRQLRARTAAGRITLSLQRIVQFPGTPPITESHARPGHTVLVLKRAAIDVLPDGRVANQQIIEQAGPANGAPDPLASLSPYEEAATTTPIQVLIAISWAAGR